MIVQCPQCKKKYQIPDEKIKGAGVRVACRNCENKFNVTPTPEQASLAEKIPVLSDSEFSQRGIIGISFNPGTEVRQVQERRRRKESPPARSFETDETSTSLSDSMAQSVAESSSESVESAPAKPSPPPKQQSEENPRRASTTPPVEYRDTPSFRPQKQMPIKWIAASVIAVGITIGYFRREPAPETISLAKTTAVTKSNLEPRKTSLGYAEDLSASETVINQSTTMSESERSRSNTRNQIAQALITRGIMKGNHEDIVSGLMLSARLLVSDSNAILGFIPLLAYAEWTEDISAISEIAAKWPASAIQDPEYELAKIILDAKEKKNLEGALARAKVLTETLPQFQRAVAWTVSLALDNPGSAQKIFGKSLFESLLKKYQAHQEKLKGDSPPLYQTINKKVLSKGISGLTTSNGNDGAKSLK